MDNNEIAQKALEYGVTTEFLVAFMDLVTYEVDDYDVSWRIDETDFSGKRMRYVPYLEHAAMVNILHSTIKPLRWRFDVQVETTPAQLFIPVQQYTKVISKWNYDTRQNDKTQVDVTSEFQNHQFLSVAKGSLSLIDVNANGVREVVQEVVAIHSGYDDDPINMESRVLQRCLRNLVPGIAVLWQCVPVWSPAEKDTKGNFFPLKAPTWSYVVNLMNEGATVVNL